MKDLKEEYPRVSYKLAKLLMKIGYNIPTTCTWTNNGFNVHEEINMPLVNWNTDEYMEYSRPRLELVKTWLFLIKDINVETNYDFDKKTFKGDVIFNYDDVKYTSKAYELEEEAFEDAAKWACEYIIAYE